MTPDEMEAIVLSFPGVEKGKSYGSPAYLLNGKFFTRLRRDDQSIGLPAFRFIMRDRRFRKIAKKTVVKAYDAEQAG